MIRSTSAPNPRSLTATAVTDVHGLLLWKDINGASYSAIAKAFSELDHCVRAVGLSISFYGLSVVRHTSELDDEADEYEVAVAALDIVDQMMVMKLRRGSLPSRSAVISY